MASQATSHVPARRRRPRRVLLVAVVALLAVVGGFVAYGAWTRSTPVHYARGGDAFAVVPTPSGATSPAPRSSAAPSASPSPSTVPRPAGVVPSSAPPAGAVAPPPAHTPPHGVALPRVGGYGLRVDGSEKVDFGPVSFCSQSLPTQTSLVVSHAAGEGPASFDFDLRYFPGQSGKHDERHLYRYTSHGVYLDYEIATVTCQGVRQSSDTQFSPPQLRARLPLAVGATWHNTGGDSDRTETSTSRVVRAETLRVAGALVPTYVIETRTTFTGSESGSRTQTWWYAPSWAMPVKWSEHIDGHRSGAAYSENVTVTVESRP